MNENPKTLIDAKKVGIIGKVEKSKYLLSFRYKNAGQIHDMKRANKSSENVAHLKYLETTLTNQNMI
jgi:hypothetical protein